MGADLRFPSITPNAPLPIFLFSSARYRFRESVFIKATVLNRNLESQPCSTAKIAPRLSAWRIAAYRRLWFGTVIMALANQCERLAVGWLVLVETDSVFLTAASFAARKVPSSLVAPIAGAISDQVSRSRMLAVTALYKAVSVALLGFLTLNGVDNIGWVFILVALSGIGQSFEVPATQGLITDTVPQRLAMRAVALQSTGSKAMGALGSLVGGLVITEFGVAAPFFTGAGIFLIGAIAMLAMPHRRGGSRVGSVVHPGILLEALKALAKLIRLPVVGTLLLVAFVVEMFGFAYNAVLPSVARDLLFVDASGLGTLTLMAGVGSVIGVAILATLGYFPRKGLLLISITIGYGLMLIGFAASGIFALSIILVMGVGAMAAVFDAMQWTLLQQHVPDGLRGRAIGGWVFAISFGWIGQLTLGAVSQTLGVQWALAGAGGLVILTGLAAYVSSAGLRAA